ncbi:MAG: GMC family oxidoreductase, partial [Bdellovibrionales bacterium]|nr:GMC family oxidoreductase [Bdellovibrionales bacterium]
MKNIFDVVVIGSGYGGMLPAYKLVKSGYKVLLIERGKHWNPDQFKHELSLEYLNNLYDISSSKSLNELYRGSKILGGGSVTNDKIHQRCPSESFEYIDQSINKKAWPAGLNRQALDPYYSELEELLSIKQLPWNEVSRIGGNFARMFDDAGMSCEPCSFNVGPGCVHCGFCEAGCRYEGEGKLTLTSEVLPKAMATGNLTIKTEMTAKSVKPLIGGEYRVSLIKSDKKNMNSKTCEDVFGKKVIIAAGPIGTVPLLNRSARHLPKLSPALGKWASNNGDVNFVLKIPEHYPDHIGYKSSTSCGVITYGYWDKYKKTIHPGMIPIQVAAGVDLRRENGLPWGLDHKHFLKKNVVNRLIPANGMGLVPSDMKIGIDVFGLPTISNPVSKGQEDH